MKKQTRGTILSRGIWIMIIAMVLMIAASPAAFADDATEEVSAAPVEELTVPQVEESTAAQTEEAALQTEDPEAPAAEPEEPVYAGVYRIEVADGVMRCYWYDELGIREEEGQKDKYFIVTFDEGSDTEGSARSAVGKSGKLYYFDKEGSGQCHTGWFKQKGKKYYFNKGKRLKGIKKVKKTWYEFSKTNGKLIRKIGDGVDKKIQGIYSRTSYLIVVKLKEFRVRVYKGKKNRWTRIHKFKCTVGSSSSPTVRGSFTIGSRGRYFNTGSSARCWYWTQFYGNYLFHSVIYDRSSSPIHIIDGRLGVRASHGCIRLALGSARWINNTIPSGTKVYIY